MCLVMVKWMKIYTHLAVVYRGAYEIWFDAAFWWLWLVEQSYARRTSH